MDRLGTRVKKAWNAFRARDETKEENYNYQSSGPSTFYNPSRSRMSRGNERSILTAVFNRIAIDVAAVDFQHVKLDQNGRYISTMDSPFNECLSVEANIDQTGRTLIQDIVMSMFDEGVIAVVAVDADDDPNETGAYNIYSLRVAKIVEWYPSAVRLELYNERTGRREYLTMEKNTVAIIENPLFAVMNEPNSTVKRLTRKLNLLDAIDEQSSSGKLDLIIQLPYTVRSEKMQEKARQRRNDIEEQLTGSRYGIAYTDGTERITQLNRPSENNLLAQITYLTNMAFSQIGVSERVFNGTADEKEMLNYYSRTINPIVLAIIEPMRRVFLTKTARTQGQAIMGFRDMFRLVSATEMAKIADSFTRNEIISSNEVRSIIGLKPSTDPRADELRNRNMPAGQETGKLDEEEE